ncbi:MAG: hypothetical protein ACPGEG_00015 [Salibacteraceae bacterium]
MRVFVISLIVLVASCSSVDELIESGRYDEAINKGIRKVDKKPTDHSSLKQIEKAYRLAQAKDLSRVAILVQMEESVSGLESIYQYTVRMTDRAQKVATYDIGTSKETSQLLSTQISAQENLCKAIISEVEDLMETGLRGDYRSAYYNLDKVSKYGCEYPESDSLKRALLELGKATVALQIETQKGVVIPENTEKRLKSLPFDRNKKLGIWVDYRNTIDLNVMIDYTVITKFNQVQVTKPKTLTTSKSYDKKIIEKYEYKKREDGSTEKIPVYKTIKGVLKTHKQSKSSTQGALVYILDNNLGNVKFQKQLVGTYNFNHTYYTFTGDRRVLSTAQVKKLKIVKKSFPSNAYMVDNSGKKLVSVVSNQIYQKRNIFK